ncbi:Organic cation/carnitine transporter 7 [Nymphaea thermarum]|nr:Organic cation/carnitine transporter 7 [Nymphaea thermarum]
MPTLGWRWLLALSSVPSIILLLFYRMVPESPRYLCMRGRTADALHILEKIAVINKKQLPSGILVSDHIIENELQTCQTEDAHLLSVRKLEGKVIKEAENQVGAMTSLSLLLSQKLIRTTLLIWMVFFAHAFSYYGLVLLTTELSSTSRNCVPNDFHKIDSKNNNLYRDVLVTSFAEFPGLLLSMAVVDRIGRKLSMSAMLFMCCILLIPLVFHQSELLTTCLLFGARLFISGSFTILYIYVPEVYPTTVRTTGFGTASSVGRIGGMLCPLVAVALLHACHQILSIFLFEIVIFSSGVAVLLLQQETKGCALNDII